MSDSQTDLDRLLHWPVMVSYVAALVVFVIALILTYLGDLWVWALGGVSSISVGSVAVLYAFCQYRFRSAGFSEFLSVVIALLFANVFLQVYEVVYGLSFGLAAVVDDPVAVTGTDVRTFALWMLMILPVFLFYDRLRFTRWSAIALVLTGLFWVVWILYGFPQYYYSGYAFHQYLKTSDPFHLSLWLNFGTKAILGVFFLSLLEPSKALKAALRRN